MITNGVTQRELTVEDWHRLNGLLAEALDLEGEARTLWLATLPDHASDLKPLLAQLLAEAGSTGLDGTSQTLRPVVALATAAMAGMRREAAGDRIGPWRLERLLAEGGMGAVWVAARADGVMQRTAALKLPRAEWVDRGLASASRASAPSWPGCSIRTSPCCTTPASATRAGRISRWSMSTACRSMRTARRRDCARCCVCSCRWCARWLTRMGSLSSIAT